MPDTRTNEQKAAEILAIRLELIPEDILADDWYFTENHHGMTWHVQEVVRNSHGSTQWDRNDNLKTRDVSVPVPPELYQEFLNHRENGTPGG